MDGHVNYLCVYTNLPRASSLHMYGTPSHCSIQLCWRVFDRQGGGSFPTSLCLTRLFSFLLNALKSSYAAFGGAGAAIRITPIPFPATPALAIDSARSSGTPAKNCLPDENVFEVVSDGNGEPSLAAPPPLLWVACPALPCSPSAPAATASEMSLTAPDRPPTAMRFSRYVASSRNASSISSPR